MVRIFFVACLLSAMTPPVLAEEAFPDCSRAGPGMTFCAGEEFRRLDAGQSKGISLWLHLDGFISKILAEKDNIGFASQTAIEERIIAMIDAQAGADGQAFEFVDLDSREVNGAPFGTLTYRLGKEKATTTVLHSYAALDGVLVQVLSQIAPRNTADTAALRQAHGEALGALHLTAPEAEL